MGTSLRLVGWRRSKFPRFAYVSWNRLLDSETQFTQRERGLLLEVGSEPPDQCLLLPVARPLLPRGNLNSAELAEPGSPDICVHNPVPVQNQSLKCKGR